MKQAVLRQQIESLLRDYNALAAPGRHELDRLLDDLASLIGGGTAE